ncbi:hypothetical protein B0H14DRAFT_3124812 [Mycena olivaceomarginata]|nr:hypothetical protein B0H14DRAFT_3124812 [Mycena olivaceomarginata]
MDAHSCTLSRHGWGDIIQEHTWLRRDGKWLKSDRLNPFWGAMFASLENRAVPWVGRWFQSLDTVITERADLTTKTTAELVAQNQASLNLKVSNLIATIGCYYSSGKFGVEASKSGRKQDEAFHDPETSVGPQMIKRARKSTASNQSLKPGIWSKPEIETRYRSKPDILSNTTEFGCGVKRVGRRRRKSRPVNEIPHLTLAKHFKEFGVNTASGEQCAISASLSRGNLQLIGVAAERSGPVEPENDISEMPESQLPD